MQWVWAMTNTCNNKTILITIYRMGKTPNSFFCSPSFSFGNFGCYCCFFPLILFE